MARDKTATTQASGSNAAAKFTTPNDKGKDDDKDDEEDDDDDADYNPNDAQEEEDDEEDELIVEPDTTTHLSAAQRKAVDDAFVEIFGYPWGTHFALASSQSLRSTQEKLLVQILGSHATAIVLQCQSSGNASVARSAAPLALLKTSTIENRKAAPSTAAADLAQAEIAERTTSKRTLPIRPAAYDAGASGTGGVDSLLSELAGADKVTTVAKTAADWEVFKDATGLGPKLEEQAESKDAFLKRQDFLQRVDHRQFTREKQDRDAKRARRGV